MAEQKKRAAELMPDTAAFIAVLRVKLGADLVDKALAASQQAAREYRRIEAEQGTPAADLWLSRQRFPDGRYLLRENGRQIGIRSPR